MHEALADAIVKQCRKRHSEGDYPTTERPGQEQTEFALIALADQIDKLRLVVAHEGDCTQAADDEAMRRGHVIEELAMMLRRMIWLANKKIGDTSMKAVAGSARELLAKYKLEGQPLRGQRVENDGAQDAAASQ